MDYFFPVVVIALMCIGGITLFSWWGNFWDRFPQTPPWETVLFGTSVGTSIALIHLFL